MGDRISIQFESKGDYIDKKGKWISSDDKEHDGRTDKSVAFFSHWDGLGLTLEAVNYAKELIEGIETKKISANGPLGRFEVNTVMVDFIRYFIRDRVESNYYLGVDSDDGDNSNNGNWIIDLDNGTIKPDSDVHSFFTDKLGTEAHDVSSWWLDVQEHDLY